MKNYIKTNLTSKLFVLVCSVLIGASFLICGLFTIIMPKTYTEIQNEEFEQIIIRELGKNEIKTEDELKKILNEFAEDMAVYIELYNVNNEVIGSFGDIDLIMPAEDIVMGETDGSERVYIEKGAYSSKRYTMLIDDMEYSFFVYGTAFKATSEASLILWKTIPLIIIIMTVISLIVAWFLSRYITKPIKEINENAKKIAEMSFDLHLPENREDELGELSKNINLLSFKLNTALSSLKEELMREKAMEESQRLFFASASHELKTPLTVIKGNLEGIVYGYIENDEKDLCIAKTLRKTKQMESLIGEILKFSTLNNNDYDLKIKNVNLRDIIEKCLEYFSEMIELKGFIIEKSLENIEIQADEKLLIKALQNILSNAIHYSPENECIKIKLNNNMLIVENTGATIKKEDIEKIFEPFYRVEKSRNRQTGGSGLGLHFVKIILEKHNFDFCIRSDENSVIFSLIY